MTVEDCPPPKRDDACPVGFDAQWKQSVDARLLEGDRKFDALQDQINNQTATLKRMGDDLHKIMQVVVNASGFFTVLWLVGKWTIGIGAVGGVLVGMWHTLKNAMG
jgi:hypothetical protein